MIELVDVYAQKSGKPIFREFNLTIETGHNVVLTGGNGSGKTSLLELIAGILPVTRGEIRYDFIDAGTWEERYRQRKELIHFISSDAILNRIHQPNLFYQQRYYALDDGMIPTVRQFLGTPTLDELLRLDVSSSLSIGELLDRRLTQLSNGQQKKVIILESLAKKIPRVLLLDYPLDGLDRRSQADLLEFLESISATYQVQLVMSTHSEAVPPVFNRKVTMSSCSVQQQHFFQPKPFEPQDLTRERNDSRPPHRPVVEMRDVTIRYGHPSIVNKLNWTVNKGERWALSGANGSGKTTLFAMIFADHPLAYSENVSLFGRRRGSGESIWDIKKRISYLGPEQMSFLDPLDKMRTGLSYLSGTDTLTIGHPGYEIIDFFEAHNIVGKPLRAMSSGELQLVLVMKCLIIPRELILLDEPFRFLDPFNKQKLNKYLESHLDSETTLIIISHDSDDVARWGGHQLYLP